MLNKRVMWSWEWSILRNATSRAARFSRLWRSFRTFHWVITTILCAELFARHAILLYFNTTLNTTRADRYSDTQRIASSEATCSVNTAIVRRAFRRWSSSILTLIFTCTHLCILSRSSVSELKSGVNVRDLIYAMQLDEKKWTRELAQSRELSVYEKKRGNKISN